MPINRKKFFELVLKYQSIIAYSIIIALSLLLLRSAFYSIATPDESFYLTIPYRLLRGDRLIIDEWHASQFSAVLLCLPMKIFLMVTKSTEGIILYFRCLFVMCQTIVALFTFHKIKKYGTVCGFISAALYLLYVPETVNMLDYYTMSLMGFQIISLILFCSDELSKKQMMFVGFVFACVVLAQPFNCLIYFIYSSIVVIYRFKSGIKTVSFDKYLSLKTWIYITIGVFSAAICFCFYLFSQMNLNEFFHYLPNVFGGQDHTLPFSGNGSTDMFSYIVIFKTLFYHMPVGFVSSVLLMMTVSIDKHRVKNRANWLYVLSVVMIIMVFEYIVKALNNTAVYLFNPYILFVLTFVCLMLTKNKNPKLLLIFSVGVVYTVFLGIISQALDYVGVIGLVLSNTALGPACKELYDEIHSTTKKKTKNKYRHKKDLSKRAASVAVVCSLIVVIFSGIAIKCFDDPGAVAFGRSTKSADRVLREGPLKGIVVNSDIEDNYSLIINDLRNIKNNNCEKVLVAALIPWTYFCFDEAPSTFTTWYIDGELNLYESYYENVEKVPECIYVPETSFYWGYNYSETALRYREFFSKMFDVRIERNQAGYSLYRKN